MIWRFFCSLTLAGAALYSQTEASLPDQIRSAQSAGDYGAAAKLYGQLIATGTDSPEVRSNYGAMLHLSGQNREAMQQFQIALRAAPGLTGANLFAGLTELDLGEPRAAVPYLKSARNADPNAPAPLLALGRAYVATRDYEAANEVYAKAVALNDSLAEAWYGLGVTERSLAERVLNSAARSGKISDPSVKRSAQHFLDQALEALNHAVALDPGSARTHLLMAEAYSDGGKFPEAIPEYQTALKLDPTLDAATLGLASGYWKARQFDQAKPLLQSVLQKHPHDAEAHGMLADILQHDGDDTGARQHADAALAANPALIQTRVVLARIHLDKHEPQEAVAELQRVLPADPDGSYHFLLYRAYRETGDENAAQKAMAEFKQLHNAAQGR